MEAMGYDLTDYKEALAEQIGGATKEEVEAAKKEALLSDRSMKKGADLVENAWAARGNIQSTSAGDAKSQPDGQSTSVGAAKPQPQDGYDPTQHVMRACGEVDGRPNCNRECWSCMRTHCPYRDKNAKRP